MAHIPYDVLHTDFVMFSEDEICNSPLGSSAFTPDLASYLGQELSAPGWGTSTTSLSYPLLVDALYGPDPTFVATHLLEGMNPADGGNGVEEAMSIETRGVQHAIVRPTHGPPPQERTARSKGFRKEKPWIQPVLRNFNETKTCKISGVLYTIDPADHHTWSMFDKTLKKPYICLLCAVEGRKHSSRQRSEIKKHFQVLRHSYPAYGCPWCEKKWGRGSTDARHIENCSDKPHGVNEDAEDDAEDFQEIVMSSAEINKANKKASEEVHRLVERRGGKPSGRNLEQASIRAV